MAITASAVTPDKSLEEFRVEFNKLIQDFDGVASGNSFVQSIVFEGATADAFETALLVVDPTADRSITLPDVSGTVITTGNSNAGTTTSSSGDADFVLVDDGGVLKKITPANLGIGGSAGSVAADDVQTGDAAVNITTSSGNITIDAAANDTDIIFKGTDNTADITMLTLDGSDAGSATFNDKVTIGDGKLVLNSTAVTSTAAELNLLDGVSGLVQADLTKLAAVDSTAAELNIVDGGTSATGTTLVDADRLVANDAGTMVQVAMSDVKTYLSSAGFATDDPTALAIALG